MHYTYPRLSRRDFYFVRLIGPGLGNLLFPWARSVVASSRYGMTSIQPTWPQIKVGPLLRRELDKRTYHNLFRKGQNEIGGWRKVRLLRSLPQVPEGALEHLAGYDGPERVVTFEGMEGLFDSMLRDHQVIKDELLSITRDEHKAGLKYDFADSISLHVRLGDFVPASGTTGVAGKNTRAAISWYVRLVSELRDRLGMVLPAHVFSDGSDEELAELLALPRTRRLSFGSSIADILALSNARILIASSSFSMWASYLGQMPVIWPQGALVQRLYYDRPAAEIEIGRDGFIPDSFLETLSAYPNARASEIYRRSHSF